jgi:HK97 family phage major capsid protein
MPWHITKGGGTCAADKWAVIKDSDGSTEGCHDTKAGAEKQMKALYANEGNSQTVDEADELRAELLRSGWSPEEAIAAVQLLDAPPALLPDVDVFRVTAAPTVRANGTAEEVLEGHFSTFGDWYEIESWMEGHFLEQVAKGSFRKTFADSKKALPHRQIKVLLDHGFDPDLGDKPIAANRTLAEDDEGAAYEADLLAGLPEVLVSGLRAGLYGSSFRFRVLRDEWDQEPGESDHNPKGIPERTIREVQVFEYGPTPFPANPNATAGLRSTRDAVTNARTMSATDAYYDRLRTTPDPLARIEFGEAVEKVRSLRVTSTPGKTEAAADTAAVTDSDTPAVEGTEQVAAGAAPVRAEEPRTRPSAPPQATPQRSAPVADTDTMTADERVARQSEITARMAEIDNEYNGGVLPDDIQAEWNTITTEYDDHERAIAADRQRKADIARRVEKAGHSERGADDEPPRRPSLTGGTRQLPDNIYDLAAYRAQAYSVDELPLLYRRGAQKALDSWSVPFRGVSSSEAKENVQYLLDHIDDEDGTLARRILATSNPTYLRAFGKIVKSLNTSGLTSDELRVLSVGVDGEGGYAVPAQLDPTIILTSNGSINPLRAIARVEQIVGKEWQGITSAGITVTRAAEAAEAGDNAPTLAQPVVRPTRVHGFVPFSIEVDQDWASLQSEMTRLLAEAKDDEEAASFITGNGTAPNPNGLVATLNASSNVVANTFGVASLYAIEEALPPRFRPRARWVASKTIYNLVRQFDTAGGANLWVRLEAGQPPELIGYPAHESSSMSTTPGTIGQRYLILGDFSNFLIVDRVGMSVELVPHLFGASRRPTGQRGLYAIWRNNTKILTDNAFRIAHKAA